MIFMLEKLNLVSKISRKQIKTKSAHLQVIELKIWVEISFITSLCRWHRGLRLDLHVPC